MANDVSAWLRERGIVFTEQRLELEETPMEFARAHGIDAQQVAKTAFVEADGRAWLVVLPADRAIVPERLAEAIGAAEVAELPIEQVERYVDGQIDVACAFGSRLGLPVVMDEPLTNNASALFPTGDGDLFVQVRIADYLELEQPNVEQIGKPIVTAPLGGETTAELPASV